MAKNRPLPPAPRPPPLSPVLRGSTIGVIGGGTMGQALIRGWIASGLSPRRMLVADSSAAARRVVQRRFKVAVTAQNTRAARRADVVLLAVKPQQMAAVVEQIKALRRAPPLIISIAAGIPTRWFESRLRTVPVIRVMPNLPATVGCGFAAIAPGRRATRRHVAVAEALFGAVGETVTLPERRFDAITAVSGSGPAYVFFFVKVWEDAARALGLSAGVARRAVWQTLRGSVKLLAASGQAPEALIARVASKRGTTEAALQVLARRRVAAHIALALRAAAKRSKILSWSS